MAQSKVIASTHHGVWVMCENFCVRTSVMWQTAKFAERIPTKNSTIKKVTIQKIWKYKREKITATVSCAKGLHYTNSLSVLSALQAYCLTGQRNNLDNKREVWVQKIWQLEQLCAKWRFRCVWHFESGVVPLLLYVYVTARKYAIFVS